jgi:crotonobetainyl-CoA:carnitine CoA-transferase CaiB-like acyl-CoA transferase
MFMAFAIVNALYARQTSGKGQRIETSLFASGLAAQYRPLLSIEEVDRPVREGFLGELAEKRKDGISIDDAMALRRQYIAARGRNNYYRIYETKDGLIAVACLQNRQRRGLRDALRLDDPTIDGLSYDWFSEEVRQTHQRLVGEMEAAFKTRPTAEWIAALDGADVPCGPVHFPEEIFEHPHVLANKLMLDFEHDVLGAMRMPASPMRLSETPPVTPSPPPVLGAHGREILLESGYDAAAVDRLMASGVVSTRERMIERDTVKDEAAG